jgi:DNA-binding NtrC family response regulator
MSRILLLGSMEPLLQVLANILAARGGDVRVLTDPEQARTTLEEFEPHLILWDSEPGDPSLDPATLGFEGPTIVLAHHFNRARDNLPLRKVLLKPISADQLIAAVLENGAW